MLSSELERIETQLGISLPEDYRSLMTAYPFAPSSFTAEVLLPDSADWLLASAGLVNDLPANSFIIGGDGGEESYFIDVSRQRSPVFVFDLETGKVWQKASSLSVYVEQCKDAIEQIHRDEERAAKKKWWQVWRR